MSNYLSKLEGISKAVHNSTTIILGKPGSGKTTLAGTFPKPMLVISIGQDGGAEVLRGYNDDDIKTITLTNDPFGAKDAQTVLVKLNNLLDELKDNTMFKTVVIDPYTSIQENVIKYMTGLKEKQLNLNEYGIITQMMTNLRDKIDTLATGNTEYVLICHLKENAQTDSITGETTKELVPKMTITTGKILLEHPSAVLYCCKKTVSEGDGNSRVKFLTYVGAHPNIDTKFRTKTGKLITVGKYYENFTYETMKNLYEGTQDIASQEKIAVIEPLSDLDKQEPEDTNGEW